MPEDLTETAVLRWCAGSDSPRTLANNTIRGRTAVVSAFLRWCEKQEISTVRSGALTDHESPLRQFRPTYGKVQSTYPARWLNRAEAYEQLLSAVDGSTPLGLRDELVLRLGLCGVRVQEIRQLTVGAVRNLDTASATLSWTGKRYKPRQVGLGSKTASVIRSYLGQYADGLGTPPPTDAPLICRRRPGRTPAGQAHRLSWGIGLESNFALFNVVTGAAERAGLGHVAPHDLRRSAAGILHREKSDDGGHRFDLLDIQKVLGHADPVTTMKCYLDPMDTDVIERAADVLD